MRTNGFAIQWAGPSVQRDRKVLRAAFKANDMAVKYMLEEFQDEVYTGSRLHRMSHCIIIPCTCASKPHSVAVLVTSGNLEIYGFLATLVLSIDTHTHSKWIMTIGLYVCAQVLC